jgi:N-acetylglucosaminyldiphosphoundecaprenol N-acetyl-beta-D-mannosaminyltransferase
VTERQAVEQVLEWIQGPRTTRVVMPVNSALLVMMRRDPMLRAACVAGDLILADGQPLVWASRLFGCPLPERVAGCTLMQRLMERAAAYQLRVYFLGARQEVLQRLVERSHDDWPGAVIAGYRNGYFSPAEDLQVAGQVARSRADILFVALPSPRKELFCHAYRQVLQTPAVIPVGGSFDVLAGVIRRAPLWMQRRGLEWSWRLAMEPRKLWRRYLTTNSCYLALVARQLVCQRIWDPIAVRSRRPQSRP